MIKLALVGRHISHSLSPKIYRGLLQRPLEYDLLDYSAEADIEHASELLERYQGVSITSPYKEHFLDQVQVDSEVLSLKAINCLYLGSDQRIHGANTDFLAMQELIRRDIVEKGVAQVLVLGAGAMARVTCEVLHQLNYPYQQLTRQQNGDLTSIDLNPFATKGPAFIINCCSRDFQFRGRFPSKSVFWDLNYAREKEAQQMKALGLSYHDGLELLEKQAFFALSKWQITPGHAE